MRVLKQASQLRFAEKDGYLENQPNKSLFNVNQSAPIQISNVRQVDRMKVNVKSSTNRID